MGKSYPIPWYCAAMRPHPLGLPAHSALLALFCAACVCVWMAPVLLAGFPYMFTSIVKSVHLGEPNVVNPLFALLVKVLLPVVDWRNATSWALVSAVTFALTMIPLWWSIRRSFGMPTAWATIAVFAFMPMHWRLAIETGYYPLALLCLFTGFVFYLALVDRNRFAAVAALGLCFGLTCATSHAFVTFLPWFVLSYAWLNRARWPRALTELLLCGFCAYASFVLLLLPTGSLLPVEENLLPAEEVYGDRYAYDHLRDDFDARAAARAAEGGFFAARDNEHFRINYDPGSFSAAHVFLNGAWLFGNSLASLFMQETVGGAFLWLFIGLGITSLYRARRHELFLMLGLWLSMELVIRFGFHYGRIHLMNVGWVVALLAGSGIVAAAGGLKDVLRLRGAGFLAIAIAAVVVVQLGQANRSMFAGEYSRSRLPRAYAAAEAVEDLPADAVLAQPRDESLLLFTDRVPVVLQDETLDVLAARGEVADPFRRYGITHAVGYDEEHAALIRAASTDVTIVDVPAGSGVPLTPFVRYVLNVLR